MLLQKSKDIEKLLLFMLVEFIVVKIFATMALFPIVYTTHAH
jgi:hypothetical protein